MRLRFQTWLAWAATSCVGLLACLLSSSAAAAKGIGTPVPPCVARVGGETAAEMLRPSARFDCTSAQRDFGPGDFWVRSAQIPREAGLRLDRVRFATVWQRALALSVLYADGSVWSVSLDGRGLAHHTQMGATVEIRLPQRGVRATRLLWRVSGAANVRGIVRDARLAAAADSNSANLARVGLYAGIIGLCLALIVCNGALWVALRHRFLLAYATLVASLGLFSLAYSGAVAWMLPMLSSNDRIRINYLALAIATAASLAFARSFFGRPLFTRGMDRLALALTLAIPAVALAFAALIPSGYALLDHLYTAAFVAQLGVVGPVLWRGVRSRQLAPALTAAAWGLPLGYACAKLAAVKLGIGWFDDSILAALLVQTLTTAIAIAHRISLLSRERDAALENVIAARLLADTDPLTGLLNRRAFLRHAIGREGEQMLVIVDIDHFKQVNETIGHDGGDEVLRVLARTLEAELPAGALVARMGGEEFAILASLADPVDPPAILERLRRARMPYDLSVTASIGTCAGPLARETDWKALYRCADRALFDAKAAGRDRVRAGEPRALAA